MGLFGNNETITTTFTGRDNLSPVVRGIRSSMDRFRRDMTDFTRKGGIQNALLGGVGLGAGLSAFGMISGGISLVTNTIGDLASGLMAAGRAAREEDAEIAQLSNTLDNNVRGWRMHTDAIDKAIRSGQDLAFTDSELRTSLGTLALRTKSLTLSFDLMAGAQDIARDRGISLQQATLAVSKAAGGQFTALKRLGFQISEAGDKSEKLRGVFRQVNGAAKTFADTAAGRLTVKVNDLVDAFEDLGREVPVVKDGVTEFGVDVSKNVLGVLADLGRGLNVLTGTTKSVGQNAFVLNAAWMGVTDTVIKLNRNAAITPEELKAIEERARQLAGAMDFVAGSFKTTDRAWSKLIAKGDGNKRAISELDKEIQQWSRRYRRAVKLNDSEAAAVAAKERDRAIEERRQRRLVVAQINRERQAARQATAAKQSASDAAVEHTEKLRREAAQVRALSREQQKNSTLPDAYWTAHIDFVYASRIADAERHGKGGRRAKGGPVESGGTYLVGEEGPELLQMGSQSGFVHPNAGGKTVIENRLYLDGNELKGWMLRTLGREQLRSLTG